MGKWNLTRDGCAITTAVIGRITTIIGRTTIIINSSSKINGHRLMHKVTTVTMMMTMMTTTILTILKKVVVEQREDSLIQCKRSISYSKIILRYYYTSKKK